MDDKLIEVLERIADSQEELTRTLIPKAYKVEDLKKYALIIREACRNHDGLCSTCPLGYKDRFNECIIMDARIPAEWDLEEET